MNKLEKLLIFRKTTKLDYLIDKYGRSHVEKTPEYNKLLVSREIQEKNSNDFIESMLKNINSSQTLKIVTDSFLKNNILDKEINNETYDQVYSLGGDGTFLRSVKLIKKGNPVFIGVNTDLKRSFGHYCSLQISDNLEDKVRKLLRKSYKEKLISKIKVNILSTNESFDFINDLYFTEKFPGRVSNFSLLLDKSVLESNTDFQLIEKELSSLLKNYESNNNEIELPYKGSGVIFSTYDGYSGWIKNANIISLHKVESYIKETQELNDLKHLLELHLNLNGKNLLSQENSNKIFYSISQPSIHKPRKDDLDELYFKYKLMDYYVSKIKLKSFCYEGSLIIDGSFEKQIDYGDEFELSLANDKLKTIEKIN